MMRDPDQGTNSRPDSNWHHVAFGLCLDADFDFSTIADRSFYSNIDECQSKLTVFIDTSEYVYRLLGLLWQISSSNT